MSMTQTTKRPDHVDITIDLDDLIANDGDTFTALVDDATFDKYGSGSLTDMQTEIEATYPARTSPDGDIETQIVIRVYGTFEN